MTAFSVDIEERGAVSIIRVSGALDIQTIDHLHHAVLAQIMRPGCNSLDINAAALDFIDSSGIGTIVDISNQAAAANQRFRIIDLRPEVQRILDLVGLTGLYRTS